MVYGRPYQKTDNIRTALEKIKKGAGLEFDPDLTEIFVGLDLESEKAKIDRELGLDLLAVESVSLAEIFMEELRGYFTKIEKELSKSGLDIKNDNFEEIKLIYREVEDLEKNLRCGSGRLNRVIELKEYIPNLNNAIESFLAYEQPQKAVEMFPYLAGFYKAIEDMQSFLDYNSFLKEHFEVCDIKDILDKEIDYANNKNKEIDRENKSKPKTPKIVSNYAKDETYLWADRLRLRRVIRELLAALNIFAPKGKSPKVEVSRKGGNVIVMLSGKKNQIISNDEIRKCCNLNSTITSRNIGVKKGKVSMLDEYDSDTGKLIFKVKLPCLELQKSGQVNIMASKKPYILTTSTKIMKSKDLQLLYPILDASCDIFSYGDFSLEEKPEDQEKINKALARAQEIDKGLTFEETIHEVFLIMRNLVVDCCPENCNIAITLAQKMLEELGYKVEPVFRRGEGTCMFFKIIHDGIEYLFDPTAEKFLHDPDPAKRQAYLNYQDRAKSSKPQLPKEKNTYPLKVTKDIQR